ncbi:MAG: class II aldolase/adducin family protein [Paracoccaceae bacterium]
MTQDSALKALAEYSAKIGADPLLIQSAGGNTSVKFGDEMWIKASGTLLKNALQQDLFVCVDAAGIARAAREGAASADQPQEFLRAGALRPSLETCLHAILPGKFVVHVHCVNTIAGAIRQDARDYFATRLADFDWALVPYAKPGAGLAANVLAAASTPKSIYVLANHGLLVSADTMEETRHLLESVVSAVRSEPANIPETALESDNFSTDMTTYSPLPMHHPMHFVANSNYHSAQVAKSAFFPDQVLFCGKNIPLFASLDDAKAAISLAERNAEAMPPVAFMLKNSATFLNDTASQAAQEMLQCVGDVMTRVPQGTELSFLSDEDCSSLLNWDAESLRLSMNSE